MPDFLAKFCKSGLAALIMLSFGTMASTQTIIDSWKSVEIPPPPALASVTIDSAHTALLVLDMSADNCTDERRPACFRSIPKIARLLQAARDKHMLIIYSTASIAVGGFPKKTVAALEPLPGEPSVHTGPDKFFNSNLAQILADHAIKSVIVTGTQSQGAVLNTATGAALRQLDVIVPLDGTSSETPFAELYTAWHLKNTTLIAPRITLTRIDLISLR